MPSDTCENTPTETTAQLLCEAWEFLEDMPEPTDMKFQSLRESLLRRLRTWGKSP